MTFDRSRPDVILNNDSADVRAAFLQTLGMGVTWTGTDGHDFYVGTELDDRLDGLGGVDQLDGGGGDDVLIGGPGPNLLYGGWGADTLVGNIGGQGADVLAGETGDDTYVIHRSVSYGEIIEEYGEGRDVVVFEGDELYLGNAEVEVVIVSADAKARLIWGSQFANRVVGNAGNNELLGEAGDDTLVGGSGRDLLAGNAGDDVLVGGGAGSLTQMQGGVGNNTYVVGAGFCWVQETEGEGDADKVRASVDFALNAEAEVEFVTTADAKGTNEIHLQGNGFANWIIGNAGANWLLGDGGDDTLSGGEGVDTLEGGPGNDVLFDGEQGGALLGQAGDDRYIIAGDSFFSVNEAVGEGRDVVVVRGGLVIPHPDAEIEAIVAGAGAGVGELHGSDRANLIVGNALDNFLEGRGGDDTLVGGSGYDVLSGGEGADVLVGSEDGGAHLVGGEGDDTYRIGTGSCSIHEEDGQGTADKVVTSESFTLDAEVAVEILTTADRFDIRSIDLSGNEFANIIVGNAGSNILSGGLGADQLSGGGGQGRDMFVFDAALGGGNVDRIVDLRPNHDWIQLDSKVFTAIGPSGWLSEDAFVIGANAQDVEDRIVYNAVDGALLYDADGTGATAAIRFATLAPGLNDLLFVTFQVI